MHARELKQAEAKDERIFAVAAWREIAYVTDAERAALDLTEATARLIEGIQFPTPSGTKLRVTTTSKRSRLWLFRLP